MAPTYETPRRGGAKRGFGTQFIAGSCERPEDTIADQPCKPFVQLGDAMHMALASLWWRLAASGVRLPAETGVILIDGASHE